MASRLWTVALAVLLLALIPESALAHKLKIFAIANGDRIEGSVYFVGGGPAADAALRVESTDGTRLMSLNTDADGRFAYTVSSPGDQVLVADAGEGHRARFVVPASQIALGVTDVAPEPAPSHDALRSLVEEAVARQVGPLREQLNAYQDQIRLRDVLGGLGYILGLAGVAAWFAAVRRQRRGP